jgi:hypothetical protein
VINDYREKAAFPFSIIPKVDELGVAGYGIKGYPYEGADSIQSLIIGREATDISTFT